jgi:hypothetical protein
LRTVTKTVFKLYPKRTTLGLASSSAHAFLCNSVFFTYAGVMYGYLLGAALMIAAGVVEIFLGVEAAQKQLEDVAKPLTAEDAEVGEGDLELEKMKGEDAAPIESGGSGRFERQPDDRPTEKTGGES